jgi:L-arabinokinase
MSKIAGILKEFYASHQQKVYQATAPGRLDVMGGIADYSGSLLIQKPLNQETTAYVAFRDDDEIHIKSISGKEVKEFSASYGEIRGEFKVPNYDYIREQILAREDGDWAVYAAGCIIMLYERKNIRPEGVDIIITSDVPAGKGLASSAALEVAILKAMAGGMNLSMGRYDIPILAQQAENLIAHAPCGLMDQLTAHNAVHHKLLPIICQPHEVYHPIDIPDQIHFVGIDSGVSHAVSGAAYTDVRTAAFMGYSIIALNSGADIRALEIAKESGRYENLPYGGYLANISPSEFEEKYLNSLPEKISGQEFIERYKTIIDPLAFIDRDQDYAIRNAARHPVYENFRVKLMAQILKNYTTEFENYSNRLQLMGELMYQSHQSYTDCGLGHQRTDQLVQMVREKGERKGLYGARVSGGGNGGTVCILCSGLSGPEAARDLHREYAESLGEEVEFFE